MASMNILIFYKTKPFLLYDGMGSVAEQRRLNVNRTIGDQIDAHGQKLEKTKIFILEMK